MDLTREDVRETLRREELANPPVLQFTAELAGVAVEVRCRYPATRDFFRDFLTDRTPELTVTCTLLDMFRIKERFLHAAPPGETPVYTWAFLENNALHALLAEALIAKGVLLIHGSALGLDGQGYLFTAPSGVGKSTHARLWRERFGERCVMINDDKPLLRFTEAGILVCGSPWMGKHRLGGNCSAPLRAVTGLEQAPENAVRPLTVPEALGLVLEQSFRPEAPEAARAAMELKLALARRVPFYRLACTPAPEAVEALWSVLRPAP